MTVNLSVDFLGAAQVGQWLEVHPRVLKVGGSLAFVDAVVLADQKMVARASAVFRIHVEKTASKASRS